MKKVKKPATKPVEAKLPHHFYTSWLFSENIMKRSFAVFGHYFLAGLIIWGAFFVLVLFFGVIAGLLSV